ncbi:VIGLN-like protein [Mya arenaria]|uniref:VIGLN-like protein n=1 Tax=Mya arenaria TaxID=6604 RepID=A0ABY7F098_MYAAR|nr:VIGLN-like protein [Mya arenaria]
MATNPGVMEDYGNAFPVLNSNPTDMSSPPNLWTNLPKIPTVRSSKCTQVFTVPLAERKFRDDLENSFGDEGKQADVCKDIMARTGVTIEMSLSRDQTLTVVVSGREDQVKKARREVMTRLQTQANQTIRIPREHHRFILGAKGLKLQELELVTATKITIPRENENSDVIRIMGTKEGIDKAMHDIQVVSDIQSKLANERLPVQKVYHPFVCGPNNSTIKQLMEETGAKINVPPPSVMKDEIVVTGEKEGVMKCKATIMAIYEEKCRKCQTVSVEVRKSQHKYVIGPRGSNLQEILANTGVSVEVPPLDSSSETITLRGEQDKLGPALTMVYSKANSVVFADISAPDWLHKYIIGKKGSTIRNITANFPKVEGPPEEVDDAVKALQDFLRDLQSRMDFAEIEIDQRFHKHIIGKGGANITKIKNETNVAIKIPSDQENSNTIRIEGEPNGVKQAKQELLEMAARMENEKSRDILIEQRFHRMLIGAKGEGIKATRDKFNQVQITFPDQGKKSDVVTLRGPKTDVDKCFQYLTKMTQDLIREETDTRIDLPNKPSDSDVIVITGVKANVEAAKKRIEDIQKELANIKEVSVEVPHKLHNSIIGAKGRLIRSIMDECGGVIIRFPPEGSTSDKVTIRGPAEDVDKAKTQLQELSKQVDNIVEGEVNVDPKYHKHFVARRGEVLRQIGDDFGGVTVSFPRSGVKSDKVVIKGAKDCVEGAKKRILEIVADLVMIECDIPQQFHRTVMGARGSNVQEITSTFDVQIKFPDRPIADKPPAEKPTNAGDAGDAADAGEAPEMVNGEAVNGEVKRNNIITITGKDLVPITKEVIVPFDFHKNIIGQKGRDVRKLMDECNVNISIPPQQQQSDVIKVTGPPANVQRAEEALAAKVSDLELDKEDRLLKSFEIKVEVSPDYHPKLIGRRGEVINKIRSDHDVRIQLPERNDEDQSVIRIIGYERNCEAARDEILRMVKDYEDQVHLEVRVDHRIHSRIIGQKGRGVRRIQDDFKVDLRFPRGNDDKDILVISGAEDDVYECKDHLLNMEEEFLQDIIDDEYLKSLQKPSRIEPERPKRSENPGFYTKNAPWDKDDGSAPDTSSTSEFPSFPGATGGSAVAPKSSFAWGPMRRK